MRDIAAIYGGLPPPEASAGLVDRLVAQLAG